MADLNPFLLAAVVPDPDPRLLPLLRSKPTLASAQDAHGYSLLHAAASYNHIDLLRLLVNEFSVDVNLTDEDGDTCLFVVECVDVAKCLVEELHIDVNIRNDEGLIAADKIESEQDFPEIAAYLKGHGGSSGDATSASNVPSTNGTQHLPALPPNVTINVNSSTEDTSDDLEQEPDPEFRRRIEELATRENFHTEEGQRELRDLITDAVRGVGNEDRDVRRRIG
ncbi:uncharacterized protein A1O9_10775 [Exophiala aquamarina CBS 119918]|uniref:Uncharacterized protein n=1 Tax=Exophiala aquamarina CBS 119918 TaxID=1182545 RepID=A0A072P0Y1_9EURO|nr:uncharacterized protein A1O9_10775 [Exophiala aquamarina CBS 119918]KEF53327.1 hypothetical protein A1O9_10775 [Exophiala aquamarina CBS 119918]